MSDRHDISKFFLKLCVLPIQMEDYFSKNLDAMSQIGKHCIKIANRSLRALLLRKLTCQRNLLLKMEYLGNRTEKKTKKKRQIYIYKTEKNPAQIFFFFKKIVGFSACNRQDKEKERNLRREETNDYVVSLESTKMTSENFSRQSGLKLF